MTMDAIDATGQSYKGFLITRSLRLPELQSILIELVHEETKATVLAIENNDPENLFCLSFQTFPSSSNGVAHILEHTVLCGSKKFPVKDPFFAMTRRSLNTFMNAMTGQDFTCYPASSQVEKDYFNLLEVYLDAVFHPELKEVSFLQEGHRLEFSDKKDPKSPLQYQGVVYNEMKGAMSSIESRLWQAIAKRLVPELPYGHNSGGDPKEIPSLSYEGLLEFHRTFYHPSRCLFFFYGNLPLRKNLDFITERALKGVKPIALLSPLPRQTRLKKPIYAVDSYPVAENESLEKKAQISFSWLTVPISSQGEALALCLLESILTDNDASPLSLALLNSGLCTQVDSSIDVEMSEIPWIIVCKGCEEKDQDALTEILFKTLKKIASRPIPDEKIEAALHQLEFQRTEIGGEGGPFGLTLFMRSALLKQHGSDPESALLIHTLFQELRDRLKDPDYLNNFLRKYLIDNPHFVRLTLKPDPKLALKEAEEEKERLKTIGSKLSKADAEKIVKQSEKLASYQEAIEHQSLECLPKVTLQDVPLHAKDFPLKTSKKGNLSIYHHSAFTNQILYADFGFDLPDIEIKDLSLLSLFAKLLPELGCGGRSYAENLAYQEAYTGEFDASLSLHVSQEDPDLCRPTFSIRGKALHRNREKLFHLFKDAVTSLDFSDKKRIDEWLSQHATELQSELTRRALAYAVQTSLSGFSKASFIYNEWHGIPYYQAALKWAKEGSLKLIPELKRLQSLLFSLQAPHLVLSCSGEQFASIEKENFYALSELSSQPAPSWKGAYPLTSVKPQARFIAAPVAFNAYGMRTVSYRDGDAPFLLLSTELFGNVVLHKEVREKGGAYGGGAQYSPATGNFHFFGYRDPHVENTLKAFHKAIDTIGSGSFTEQELEEAKLGVVQALDAPVVPGNRAAVAFAWLKAGRTLAAREAFRKKILSAKKEDITKAIQKHLSSQKGVLVSFLGQELFEKEKLSSTLSVLPIEN